MIIYLYVKQHKHTKLKYFGKTQKADPYKYLGSGLIWLRHLKQHGADIDTLELWKFDDVRECEKFALSFSQKNNIVESKEWANLRPENGRDGAAVGSRGNLGSENGMFNRKHTEESLEKMRTNRKGKGAQHGSANPRYGKPGTFTGKVHSEETRLKMSKPKSVPRQRVVCEHCGREVAVNTIGQHKKAFHQ